MDQKKHLVVMAGPTAVGKTRLSMALAKHYSTDILSTDARQFYVEMNIGTAKPSSEEQREVAHHLIDFLSVRQAYDVKRFEEGALVQLQKIFSKKDIAIATGGSGLYVKTLCEGIDDMPAIDPEIRKKWNLQLQKEGIAVLAEELKKVDPAYFNEADMQNPRRVLRALEMYEATGIPYSEFRKSTQTRSKPTRNFGTVKIGLNRNREELYDRINQRVDEMVKKGLIAEAQALYPYRTLTALQTVGYQELFPYFEQQYDLEEAIRLIKRNTRRFAKRQMTWFRKDSQIQWFNLSGQPEEQVLQDIIFFIDHHIKK